MSDENLPEIDSSVETEKTKEKTNEPISKKKKDPSKEAKLTKKESTEKKVAKKEEKISPEKKEKLETVEKHIDAHIAPMSQKVVDRGDVNQEVKETVPRQEEKKNIWQKIKGIFNK